ncbi:hypothetical protein G6F57_002285 [Rhizopus arrhizus]|uniref:DNA mismatch repair protein MSH3 n=1 Tax=Rhizopus oryzae TaxID=64495 RepID=A0A9P7BW59_RHIOR|nr:hypothetical protein G6F23_000366 [Rhizopus arrhizus]KAG1428938.1 hypothetical protein G6F58_000312 [Rhizopus delemar]KAG0768429.1 hypothetical protein G6F24_001951 [Rhizopus arrhizus]KAG0795509.1 hypothetical protein G6F21_002051 [Rhizopus arrhizus]KAG0817389.1 hypothetical protein G6F20_002422 [Rhizopus arrhizus]
MLNEPSLSLLASTVNTIDRSETPARPMTAMSTITKRPKCLMAITEGRGIAIEIGICLFDMNSCECTLSQFADTPTFTRTLQKIDINDPQKILMTSREASESNSSLYQLIEQYYSHISIITLSRRCFNDGAGIDYIKKYGLQEDVPGLLVGVSPKFYCLAATSGTFRFILENEDFVFADHTIKFSYQGAEGTVMIDSITARNLELVTNTTNTRTENTLLGILDKTCTQMGKRLLRMNILQPPCCLDIITDRLDAVNELFESEEGLFNIQSSLKSLVDLDHTIAFIVKVPKVDRKVSRKQTLAVQYSESKINQVIGLKQTVKFIQNAVSYLPYKDDSCILIKTIHKMLSDPAFNEFENAISNVINEDVRIQKTSLGWCQWFTGSRQAYKEAIEDIYELVVEYSESTKLNMKPQFSASSGFFIQMSTSELSDEDGKILPENFINVIKKRKVLQFTTLELKNSRMNESLAEVYLMSDKTISELLQLFRENINFLYKASEAIAILDMLASFASNRLSYNYIRPDFSGTLAIKSGRHPILDHILTFPLVPNDTFASLSSSFQIITGPNMSGKSTYLRQIALLNIMAHVGSFVPAEYASFRLCDQILSRLANDSAFSDIGTSSFMTEMRETAYLLQNVTNSSLVMMDELCRSTSPTDALGIAAAVCEELIQTKAFCFFATHFHELTRTLVIYPNVVNLQFKIDVKMNNRDCLIDYQYRIEDGNLSTENHYGLQTAQLLGLPKQVLSAAYEIVKDVAKER